MDDESGFLVKKSIELQRKYLSFSPRAKQQVGVSRFLHAIKASVLFPFYWVVAYFFRTPGLSFRLLCALKGFRLLFAEFDYARAYSLLVMPLDSVRYFEFDFMWRKVKEIQISSYLDISSPRMLPLMIICRERKLVADLVNPDKSDLPLTISLAKSFGVDDRCRFHGDLVEDVPLAAESFDLITSMSVVEHIPDDKGAVQKMWDLLKPGGVLLLSIPCAASAYEEYTNLNDYQLLDVDEGGFVFWQRFYDEALLESRIYSVTGRPRNFQIYAEKVSGSYDRNVEQKRSNPAYPYWREPLMMGLEYEFKTHLSEIPGMGVIAMEFVKPMQSKSASVQ